MFRYNCLAIWLSVVSHSIVAHEESSPCVYTFMEGVLDKVFIMRNELELLETKMNEMESRLSDNIQRPRAPLVAFKAKLGSTLGNLSSSTLVRFDQVVFNFGMAYLNGVFTAPYDGVYQFSTTIGNPAALPGEFYLKKNGIGIEFNIAGHTSGFNVGGVTSMIELIAGDKVWVEGRGNINGQFETPGYYPSFSGYLIHVL